MSEATSEREPGFYWVRYEGEWRPGLWTPLFGNTEPGFWRVLGYYLPMFEERLAAIGPRIEPPADDPS